MNILITGAYGFVGRHLCEYLEKHLHDATLLMPTRHKMDLLYRHSMEDYCMGIKIDAAIHLAATVAGLPGNIGNQGHFFYENMMMGLNFFESCRIMKIPKIINLSSVCGYPDLTERPFKESDYWNGLPHESNRGYGIAKRSLVMLGIEYTNQYKMDITNLVPINLVGENDNSDHVVMDMIRKFELAEGQPVTFWGSGRGTRELLYVGDLVEAINLSLFKQTGPWPINIGSGEEITIKELASLIKALGDYKSEIVWDDTKPEGQHARCLDITRAKEVLGWLPKTKLVTAINRTIDAYRLGHN